MDYLPTSVFTPSRHLLLPKNSTELGRWLEREFPASLGLFLYYHYHTRRYVIAQWTGKSRGQFNDVLNCGYDPRSFCRAEAEELRRRLFRPTDYRQLRAMLAQEDYIRKRDIRDDSFEDSFRHRRKRKTQIVKPGGQGVIVPRRTPMINYPSAIIMP